jgi:hypothetical protein
LAKTKSICEKSFQRCFLNFKIITDPSVKSKVPEAMDSSVKFLISTRSDGVIRKNPFDIDTALF